MLSVVRGAGLTVHSGWEESGKTWKWFVALYTDDETKKFERVCLQFF